MSKLIILAETGSDIPAETAEKYGIRLVPMHVSFGDETKDDGTFPAEEIYRRVWEEEAFASIWPILQSLHVLIRARRSRSIPGMWEE